ncbi:hypothetical protein [Virgibacillus sp. MG-45]|uniref:hypothetical protein n=1 Tax=Virgibacillus sp. MG-45 TaxID=3102791 RepID=UPI002EDBACD4
MEKDNNPLKLFQLYRCNRITTYTDAKLETAAPPLVEETNEDSCRERNNRKSLLRQYSGAIRVSMKAS